MQNAHLFCLCFMHSWCFMCFINKCMCRSAVSIFCNKMYVSSTYTMCQVDAKLFYAVQHLCCYSTNKKFCHKNVISFIFVANYLSLLTWHCCNYLLFCTTFALKLDFAPTLVYLFTKGYLSDGNCDFCKQIHNEQYS